MRIPENLNRNVAPQTILVYTRHGSRCTKRGSTREEKAAAKYERRCNCPKWIYLFHDGQDYRFSAATRSWEKAEQKKREIEDTLDPVKAELKRLKTEEESRRKPIFDAVKEFLADAKTRSLALATQSKLRTVFERQLLLWTQQNGLFQLDELTTVQLTKWRSTWHHAAVTRRNRQEILRTFFRFCIQQEWLKQNPACGLSRIIVKSRPTDYFPPVEFEKLVQATYSYGKGSKNPNAGNCAIRIRTFLLLMRCSGLRIGDAATLERSRLTGNNLLLRQEKTGEPVYIPLPFEIAEALREVPPGPYPNPNYFFWNGRCSARSAAKIWAQALRRLFRIADIRKPDGTPKRCHPHMLRDTFAVEMLLAGVLLEKVSVLLGHSSVKTTEKYYAPWVRARQRDLEITVNNAWNVQRIPGITPDRPIARSQHDGLSGSSQSPAGCGESSGPQQRLQIAPNEPASVEMEQLELQFGDRSGDPHSEQSPPPRKKNQRFPHIVVAKLWHEGKTIKEIAVAIGRLDEGVDPCHTVRAFLVGMHQGGYKNEQGELVRLPYRRRSGHQK